MSFENFGVEQLNEDDAHDEANMIRAKLGVSPETGNLPPDATHSDERRPSAEEYDNALKDLEELRKLALTNPESIELIDQILATPFLGVSLLARITKALTGNPDEIKKRWKEGEAITDIGVDAVIGQTVNELLKLRALGKQFGKEERSL